jgi:hypothetical protein
LRIAGAAYEAAFAPIRWTLHRVFDAEVEAAVRRYEGQEVDEWSRQQAA